MQEFFKYEDRISLYLQDALTGMKLFPDNSFDLAIVDPPYGASTTKNWSLEKGHNLQGMGGEWKLASHEWDMLFGIDGFRFTLLWLSEVNRLVKPTGSIWIHSTYHNSGIVNVACQVLGIEIINEVVWYKRNSFPNLSGRRLTASHETILWCHTGTEKRREYLFNYDEIKAAKFPEDKLKEPGKQMRTVWDIPNNKKPDEIEFGIHPTQKPIRLITRMLMISAKPGGRLLSPFLGSGSEVVAGFRYGMTCVGFETEKEYFDLSVKRLNREISIKELSLF
jgi:site-specific DNA-methyltransferase (adenine-specific)